MSQSPRTAKDIFMAAIETETTERTAFLEAACAGDNLLRRHVEALLRVHDEQDSLLDRPRIDLGMPADGVPDPIHNGEQHVFEQPGDSIGPYKLLQQIGEGGMGVVFMAEQAHPVHRTLALKIIKPGMDTRQVIARFEAERQALAMMDHPNIARVIDAGTTDTGRSYFVMDLVKGVPITEYCDAQHFTVRQRLELMSAVCQAVQHAHQKGIIHRDLKPSNVLVAEYDGKPVPKIIDFGVAKATDQRLTEKTMFTEYGQIIGTFEYMSPEQARFNQLDVDTRSDIYSLGVLLYELLAGSTPLEKERLRSAAYDEILRLISDDEPPRPSTRISSSHSLPSIAANRNLEPKKLTGLVRGELDWIVMKCLEKDRNRRYETPNGLARDIECYLHDEPVQACPPSAAYRLKKVVRRNKAAAAFVTLLLASVAGLGISNIAIKRERDAKTTALAQATSESARAQAVSDFLQEMLGSADAARAKGVDYKVRELLDEFSAGLGSQLGEQPEVAADIHSTMGRAYRSLKLPDKAQPHFEKAIELRRHMDGPQSEKLAVILVDYAWNLQDQQKYVEAESRVREALEIYRQRGATGGPLFHALEILQHVLINAGRDADAERVTQQALDVARQSGQEIADQANLLHRYAGLKIRQGHFAEAEQLARQAVEMHRRLHGEHHPETAFGLTTLSRALQPQQKLNEAEAAAREALVVFRYQFPEDHPNVRNAIDLLKTVLEARGDKPALEALAKEEAEYAMRSGSPEYHVRLGEVLTNQSRTVLRPDDAQRLARDAVLRSEEAHRHFRQALEAYDRVAIEYPDDFERRLKALLGLVEILKVCVATPGFAKEVDEVNRRLEAELPRLVAAFSDSSECQRRSSHVYVEWFNALVPYTAFTPTAEHALSESIEIIEKLLHSDPNRPSLWMYLANSYVWLGDIQERSGKSKDFDAAYERAIQIYHEHAAEIAAEIAADATAHESLRITTDCVQLAYFLACSGREDEAAELVRQAALHVKRVTDPVASVSTLVGIALVQLRLGDVAGFRETCKAVADVPVADADDLTKVRSILPCCCGPDPLDDMSPLVNRAEQLVANNSLGKRHVVLYVSGAALYRAGQYERAAERLEESIDAYPSDPAPGDDVINYQQLFLAMTKWKLGERDEARRLLAETLPALDKELQSPASFWIYRLGLEVLRREAVAMIKSEEAEEAVENEIRNSDQPQHPQP